jgi:hypothetical protein
MLNEKIDRSSIFYGNQEMFDKQDKEYWETASMKEKLQTITYLRECFYGKEATTGRLQRIYRLFKLE